MITRSRLFTLGRARLLVLAGALTMLAGCIGGGDPQGEPIQFTVPRGAGFGAVTDTLANRGIIENPRAFRLYARYRGIERDVRPGIYEVQRGLAWDDLIQKMVTGDVVEMRITLPEGWTAAQIGERIAALGQADADSVIEALLSDSVAARYDLPGPTAEGYLYPATYVLPTGTPANRIVERVIQRYKQVWTPERRARADSIGLTEREVVTLASIIEKEARVWGERDTISAVYHNRLRIGMPLQADPTVQYALGAHQTRLLYAHIDSVADHPYNTYRRRGLPPGPIASPSEGAIDAALNPADVDFLYFVARPDGRHIFTRSLREHNNARIRISRMRNSPPDTAGG